MEHFLHNTEEDTMHTTMAAMRLSGGLTLAAGLVAMGILAGAFTPAGAAPPGPLSVQEANTDTNGFIRIHEQGTANVSVQGTPNVNVANANLPVTLTNTTVPVN